MLGKSQQTMPFVEVIWDWEMPLKNLRWNGKVSNYKKPWWKKKSHNLIKRIFCILFSFYRQENSGTTRVQCYMAPQGHRARLWKVQCTAQSSVFFSTSPYGYRRTTRFYLLTLRSRLHNANSQQNQCSLKIWQLV